MQCQRKDERGYAMAALLVAIGIMMVFLGVAMPVWNQQAKREREEELLFRLKQYAHAIALYQRRVPGGQPPSIDLLVEQRYLRRKYKDPITGEDFAILRVGQVSAGMTTPLPGMVVPGAGGSAPDDEDGRPGSSGAPGSLGSGGAGLGRQPSGLSSLGGRSQPGIGAIRGVVSTSKETSLREWKGRTRYDQWEVTPEDIVPRFGPMIQNPLQQGPGMGPGVGSGMRPGLAPGGVGSGIGQGGIRSGGTTPRR